MKKGVIFLFLISFLPLISFADAIPTFNEPYQFVFFKDGKRVTKFDSACIIFHTPKWLDHTYDTSFLTDLKRPFDQSVLIYDDKQALVNGASVKSFQIYLVIDGEVFSLKNHTPYSGKYYAFDIIDSHSMKDVSPFFYIRWYKYFFSLLLTITLELGVSWLFRKSIGTQFRKFQYLLIAINLITHPTLWYIKTYTNIHSIPAELGVMVIESIFLISTFRYRIGTTNMFQFSLFANIASWWIGGLIYLFMLY